MLKRRDFLITSMAASALLAVPVAAETARRRFDAAGRLRMLEVGQLAEVGKIAAEWAIS